MKRQASLEKIVALPATKDRVWRSLVDDKPLTRIYVQKSRGDRNFAQNRDRKLVAILRTLLTRSTGWPSCINNIKNKEIKELVCKSDLSA